MASHIACEAIRKGLETQVATLTTGYDGEINRLQAEITALAGDKTAVTDALRDQHDAQMKQHTADIVQLKAVQSAQTAKLVADQKQAQEDLQQHQHVAAKLQAQVESLQQALDGARDELLQTKASMSKSIGNLRSANRAIVSELEKKHAQSVTEYERRLARGSMGAILVHMKSKSWNLNSPVYVVKRCDPLSVIAGKLHEGEFEPGEQHIDFGVKCTSTPACIHRVTDSSRTMEELGVDDGDTIFHNWKGKAVGDESRKCGSLGYPRPSWASK